MVKETKQIQQVIFQGKLETAYTKKEHGLWYFYVEAYSYTKDWERVKKSRSFLNGAMTYLEVARKVLADYGKTDIRDEVTNGALISEFLLQYEESDCVFLCRLASRFGTYLLLDVTDNCKKIYCGIPNIHFGTVLDKKDYVLCKDLLYYVRVLEPAI